MSMNDKKYRVRIIIYNSDKSHEEPDTWTDEPLYANTQDISAQALRTQRYFTDKSPDHV